MIPGPGVPTGGQVGQFLRKRGVLDFDTEWYTQDIYSKAEVDALISGVETGPGISLPILQTDVVGLVGELAGKAVVGHSHTSDSILDFAEAVQDVMGACLTAGPNTTINYNDAAGTISISSTGGGGGSATLADGDYGALNVIGGGTVWNFKNNSIARIYMTPMAGKRVLGCSNPDGGNVAEIDMIVLKGMLQLVAGDIGLGLVNNTSDLDKPISTATQAALDLKAPLSHSHNDLYFTEAEVTAALALKSDTTHDHAGVYQNADATLTQLASLDPVANPAGVLVSKADGSGFELDTTFVKTWRNIPFTGTGAAQNITLWEAVPQAEVFVFVAGLAKIPGTDFTVSGTTLTGTFTNGAAGLIRYLGLVDEPAGSDPLTAPVLTMTSATGTNPPTWDFVMADLLDGDTIELSWSNDGNNPDDTANESHTAEGSEETIDWTTFTGFAGSSTVKWKMRYGRDPGTGMIWSPWSNILSDVMGATAFAPSSLYGVGDVGYAWDTTDLSKIWQNNDGTTAGAFNSVVGRINDVSGLNNHLNSLDNTSRRPVLQNVANGMMDFDGSNDCMSVVPCLWAGGAGTVIMAVKGPSQDGTFLLAETNSGSAGPVWAPGTRTNINQDVLFYDRNDAFSATAVNKDINIFDDTTRVYAIVDDGTTVTFYNNGTSVATHNYTSRAALGAHTGINQAHIGQARPGNTDFDVSPSCYIGSGIVIDRALSGTELTNAINWVKGKHGL